MIWSTGHQQAAVIGPSLKLLTLSAPGVQYQVKVKDFFHQKLYNNKIMGQCSDYLPGAYQGHQPGNGGPHGFPLCLPAGSSVLDHTPKSKKRHPVKEKQKETGMRYKEQNTHSEKQLFRNQTISVVVGSILWGMFLFGGDINHIQQSSSRPESNGLVLLY